MYRLVYGINFPNLLLRLYFTSCRAWQFFIFIVTTLICFSSFSVLLQEVRGDYQNCSVLCCVLKLCTVISTLRLAVINVLWVLSHWAHFTVRNLFVFIRVYCVCFCSILHSCRIIVSTVGWT